MARIPVVNAQDEVVEYAERKGFFVRAREEGLFWRVATLWLTSPDGKVLLAQRSHTKDVNPGLWGPAAAGTVEEGETYESNILKETQEEIGLTLSSADITPAGEPFQCTPGRGPFIQVFTTVREINLPDLILQEEEVMDTKLMTMDELTTALQETPELYVGSFPYILARLARQ